MASNTTLDDASDFISYGGDTWGTNHTDDPRTPDYSEGTFHATIIDQAWARLCWKGADITVFGAKRGNHGIYATVIDNGELQYGDGYSKEDQIQAVLFASQGLEWKDHSISIFNANKVNATKGRIWFDVDHVNFVGWPIDCGDLPEPTVKPSNTVSSIPSFTEPSVNATSTSDATSVADSVSSSSATTSSTRSVVIVPLTGSSSSAVSPTTTVTLSSSGTANPSSNTGAVAGANSGASLSTGMNAQLALFGVIATYLIRRFV